MKLIFFHMNQLGDLLFSLPVLSAARKEWPGDRLYCIARPELLPLLEASGLADVFMSRRRTGVSGTISEIMKIRSEGIDKGIFFSESPESLMMGLAGGIRERIGFSTASLSFLLTRQAERVGVPSINNNKKLGIVAGLKDISGSYRGLIKIPEKAAMEACDWLKARGIDSSKLVIISPGASNRRKNKSWGAANWKQIAVNIVNQGYTPVFSGAPSERAELEALSTGFESKVSVFASENGILSLAALMKKAKLFVGIDSGAMHLAACVGTKVAALFGPTDPSQVGPLPLKENIIIKKNAMSDIKPEEVWEKITGYIA